MTRPKHISDVPATKLNDAIVDAINAHAYYHTGKVVHIDRLLAALADVVSDNLANISDDREREICTRSFCFCIAATTEAKRLKLVEDNPVQQ